MKESKTVDQCKKEMMQSFIDAVTSAGGNPEDMVKDDLSLSQLIDTLAQNGVRFTSSRLKACGAESLKNPLGYFVCSAGYIWCVNRQGESNYPLPMRLVECDSEKLVQVLMPIANENGEQQVYDEFVLWESLTDLALCIEEPGAESEEISLERAVWEEQKKATTFRRYWLKLHKIYPEEYPLRLLDDVWAEQLQVFEESWADKLDGIEDDEE